MCSRQGGGTFAECAPRAVQELAVLIEPDPLSQLLDHLPSTPRTRCDAPVMSLGRGMGQREWLPDTVLGAQKGPELPGRPLTGSGWWPWSQSRKDLPVFYRRRAPKCPLLQGCILSCWPCAPSRGPCSLPGRE